MGPQEREQDVPKVGTAVEEVVRYFEENKAVPPSGKDKYLANSGIETPETKTANFIGGQKGAVSVPLHYAIGIGAGAGLAAGALVYGLGRAFGYEGTSEPISEPTPVNRGISSIYGPTSFNDTRLVDSPPQKPETKKVKPEEIFDPNAKEIVVTANNSILFTEGEYNPPPLIDPNNPDAVTTVLPLKLNVKDGEPVKLKLKRASGKFSVLEGKRHINSKSVYKEDGSRDYTKEGQLDNVFDTVIIEEGLTAGSELSFFYDTDDLHSVTIKRLGQEKADGGKELEKEVFIIEAFNKKDYPNEYGKTGDYVQMVIVIDSPIQLLKDIPPSEIVELGNGRYRKDSTPVPLGPDESFARITKPSKSNYLNGQAMMYISSRVKQSDGTINGGAAEVILANSNNKFVLITNKPK